MPVCLVAKGVNFVGKVSLWRNRPGSLNINILNVNIDFTLSLF